MARLAVVLVSLPAIIASADISIAQFDGVDVFLRGEGGYECIKIPSLTSLASGVLLATGEGRWGSCSDYAPTDLVFKRSLDNGTTWSPLAVLYAEPGGNGVPPNIIGNAAPIQLTTGRIVLPFCRNNSRILVTHSDDDGQTWLTPVEQPNATLPSWTWIGTGPPSSLQLPSGRIVVPSYHSSTPGDDGELSAAHVLLSDDGGMTFRLGGSWDVSPHFANEQQCIVLPSPSRIWCNARGLLESRLGAVSIDEGESWIDMSAIPALEQPLGGCEGSTVVHPGAHALFYSGLAETSPLRFNLTLWTLPLATAIAGNATNGPWQPLLVIDANASAYTALALLHDGESGMNDLGLLYERSNRTQLVFEPDAITFRRLNFSEIYTLTRGSL